MGAPRKIKGSSTGPTVRTPVEMAAVERSIDAHDAPVDGMEVLEPAPPIWAAFRVEVYDKRVGRFVFHSWTKSKEAAQDEMASIKAMGQRARHSPAAPGIGRFPNRQPPQLPKAISEEEARISELQQRLRTLWEAQGRSPTALPTSIVVLERLILANSGNSPADQ